MRVRRGTVVASVCGKRSRVAHGIWSLLVLSALADSSDSFDGTHRKPRSWTVTLVTVFYCRLDMTKSCVTVDLCLYVLLNTLNFGRYCLHCQFFRIER